MILRTIRKLSIRYFQACTENLKLPCFVLKSSRVKIILSSALSTASKLLNILFMKGTNPEGFKSAELGANVADSGSQPDTFGPK